MDVMVKHNGTNITGFIKSYERVHKICTGIGTLTVEVIRTINRQFDPWDTIDIHENGSLQVRYYISETIDSIPNGTITLECQDISKRLVDYFIPDSYTIDYPSYTRYWIEKFLDEAGLNYNFVTTSQGNLLSNYTQLGLAPAYEQIQTLLQLSGWYMYFDGNGTAIIGELDVDLAQPVGNVGKSDILQISKVIDDKMLRNRAVVWGAFDPIHNEYAYADVKVHTPWNYDSRDLRTMVVSNSNIPNISSAYGIANTLLKEFAKITTEKHIVLWGARGWSLGKALRVASRTWTGRGLITTYGVTMSKDGLVTNIILDERCPRLYGFFNFGDYVYVGTYGHGVWRKHIRFDHTWRNFSTGLVDLAITDLHINNDVFGAVSASGDLYYNSSSEGSWNKITLSSLMSSQEPDVASGQEVTYVPFSGIKARATIIDRVTNNVKFGVDNSSGLNYGDYFMQFSGVINTGIFIPGTGVSISGGDYRGWILEYSPYTGQLVGGIGSGVYPISISGNYNITVLDLENDGFNDYVSVSVITSGIIPHNENGYNFGNNNSTRTPPYTMPDSDVIVAIEPNRSFSGSNESKSSTVFSSSTGNYYAVFNNEMQNERDVFYFTTSAIRYRITKTWDGSQWVLGSTTTSINSGVSWTVFAISKLSEDNFRIFYTRTGITPPTSDLLLYEKKFYKDWDLTTNTLGSEVEVSTFQIYEDQEYDGISPNQTLDRSSVIIGDVYYGVSYHIISTTGAPDTDVNHISNYVDVYTEEVDLGSGIGSSAYRGRFDFHDRVPGLFNNLQWSIFRIGLDNRLLVSNLVPQSIIFISENNGGTGTNAHKYVHAIYTIDGSTFIKLQVQETFDQADRTFFHGLQSGSDNNCSVQLTDNEYLVMMKGNPTTTDVSYVYNGNTISIVDLDPLPFQYAESNIYPIMGTNGTRYVAKNGTDWYFCNPQTYSPETLLVATGYTIIKPYSTSDSAQPFYYWQATRDSDSAKVILKTTTSAVVGVIVPAGFDNLDNTKRGHIVGNMFLDGNGGAGTNPLRLTYLDNTNPPAIDRITYMVLQRDNSDFHLIEEENYPIRVEISNGTPLWTVGSGDDSFHSHIINQQEVITIIPSGIFGPTTAVHDFRYTLLEPVSGGAIVSGLPVSTMGLYVSGSNVFADDILVYSGFEQMLTVPSGFGNRIETSNAAASGQYIFVTISGEYPMFYQKDPGTLAFIPYSGLPQSRATIIRLDDFI